MPRAYPRPSPAPPPALAHHPRRLLAVALGRATMAEALAALPQVVEQADAVELRLDLFEEPFDLPALLAARGRLPAVVTLRPLGQGGRSPAPAPERLAVLLRAADLGAEYVDLEWDAATPQAVAALHAAGAGVVVSRHDFERMPADLPTGWYDDLAQRGADVVKLVGMAAEPRDCLPVLRAFRRAERPLVAIGMGEAGFATRVLALREERCFLTYAALGEGTAPGQVAVHEMREAYGARRLGPGTAAYGILAPRLAHVLAARHNRWLAAAGVDAVAVPFLAADDAPGIVSAFRDLPMAGWHVHGAALQETVGQALDTLDGSACRAGKVNAIVAEGDGALRGAWVESPEAQHTLWTGQAVPPVADAPTPA